MSAELEREALAMLRRQSSWPVTKCVWKFPIEITDGQLIEMPHGARVIAVQAQRDAVCLWAIVEPGARREERHVIVAGTGHQLPPNVEEYQYAGTFQLQGGLLVFHVFISPTTGGRR